MRGRLLLDDAQLGASRVPAVILIVVSVCGGNTAVDDAHAGAVVMVVVVVGRRPLAAPLEIIGGRTFWVIYRHFGYFADVDIERGRSVLTSFAGPRAFI